MKWKNKGVQEKDNFLCVEGVFKNTVLLVNQNIF